MIDMIKVLKPTNEPSELSLLIDEYEKRFGGEWESEEFYLTPDDLKKIFKKCLKENKTFYEIIGVEPYDPKEYEE